MKRPDLIIILLLLAFTISDHADYYEDLANEMRMNNY